MIISVKACACHSLLLFRFWRALRSFDQTDRAKFLQFVTGSSKVPLQVIIRASNSEHVITLSLLQGFGALEGMNGSQKFQIHRDDRSTDRLPAAHTCFNQLDLPAYEVRKHFHAYSLTITSLLFADLRQAEELLAESHPGVLRRLWIRLERELCHWIQSHLRVPDGSLTIPCSIATQLHSEQIHIVIILQTKLIIQWFFRENSLLICFNKRENQSYVYSIINTAFNHRSKSLIESFIPDKQKHAPSYFSLCCVVVWSMNVVVGNIAMNVIGEIESCPGLCQQYYSFLR